MYLVAQINGGQARLSIAYSIEQSDAGDEAAKSESHHFYGFRPDSRRVFEAATML